MIEQEMNGLKMSVPARAIKDGMAARVLRIHIGRVLNQQSDDVGVAVARGMMNRMITPPVGGCRQPRMPRQQCRDPVRVADEQRREELPR